MRIDVLSIPGCPNGPLSLERVHDAVKTSGVIDAEVQATLVVDSDGAVAVGMHGSPTILIDGRDPFAEFGTVPSISCRLYRTANGPQGCPTVAELIDVIRADDR